MSRVLIGLGSNLGDRADSLARAVEMLRAQPGTTILAQSGWHRTAPIGGPAGQGDFLNGALLLETALGAEELHQSLRTIEARLGRERAERWGPRTLDLDLLLYEQRVINTPRLVVPHPRMAFRRFVLEPAAEVAADMEHPRIHWTIAQLLDHLNTAVPYVAIAGLPGVGKRRLAQALAESQGGVFLPDPLDAPDAGGQLGLPSGPTLAAEIELLDRRADLLDADRWPNLNRLTVTDFWFQQSLAYGEIGLDHDAGQKLREHWHKANCSVLAPKLLVMLQPSFPRGSTLILVARLQGVFPKAVRPEPTLPVLHVYSATPAKQLAEVSAAVEAMK